ncbi:hypothetical protein ACFWA9_06500 [Kitasatospora sp. NPDC059973]|uniref:hypothetical protein n=1 Tax=Kitasatospora sp. NPDC059973 TaxID=3347020 RepID=UPI0036D06C83
MANPPDSTKTSLAQRRSARARTAWPQLTAVHVRCRGTFVYVDGELLGGERFSLALGPDRACLC